MPEFGIITGSGLYNIPGLVISESVKVNTLYGEPSDLYRIGIISGKEVAFLPRHGATHNIQPHKINYRANIFGFRELGVKKIISIGASGGINRKMEPGLIAVPDQLIDFTEGRLATFYDRDEVVHIDFTEPFCSEMRNYVFKAAKKARIKVSKICTYVCTNGPRLETPAEIRAFSILGADIVGMTAMPEAALARELGMCLAGISVLTNFAAGVNPKKLTATEVVDMMQSSAKNLTLILKEFFNLNFSKSVCDCSQALKNAKM